MPKLYSQSQLHPVVPQRPRTPPAATEQCPEPEPARLGVMGQVGAKREVKGLGGARTLEREREEQTVKIANVD